MNKYCEYAGLTKELHQRLVLEFSTLKEQHPRKFTQYIMETKQCNRLEARKYAQRNVIKERSRLSPVTLDEMCEYITDGLANDLREYLLKHYFSRQVECRPDTDKKYAGLPEELFKQYCEEIDSLKAKYPNGFVAYIREIRGCEYQEANSIRTAVNTIYTEIGIMTPRKVIQLEGLLSRELFSKIAKYVFNKYEWPESLDSEVDCITLKYRTKGELGRNKASVKRTLYKAIAMGL